METIRIAVLEGGPSLCDMEAALAAIWNVAPIAGAGFAIMFGRDRVYLRSSDSADAEVLVDYRDVTLMKKVLLAIANDTRLTVDNDFGAVLRGDHFVDKRRVHPNWNWVVGTL
jgi:hypothetical protein